jgi:hypothetical protein
MEEKETKRKNMRYRAMQAETTGLSSREGKEGMQAVKGKWEEKEVS